ncbi:hypothetical protein SAMN05216311_1238 [Chitinophaga sp. CF418]|nr:hypothetical protein SAMN05216311_1238 [Chitinophaga sp. CF418]
MQDILSKVRPIERYRVLSNTYRGDNSLGDYSYEMVLLTFKGPGYSPVYFTRHLLSPLPIKSKSSPIDVLLKFDYISSLKAYYKGIIIALEDIEVPLLFLYNADKE